MKIINRPQDWFRRGTKTCLAIGFFDGVHLGHQQVIRQTIADARQHAGAAVVVTFDRHPNAVVAPDRIPPLIYPLFRKVQAIRASGVEALLLLEFNEMFSRQSGEDFVHLLAAHFAPLDSVCVGGDFVFGHRRSGNVELLRRLGGELGFRVHALASVALDNEVVSSTRIREYIRAGNVDAASQMLGRPYTLNAKVVTGDGRGREIGFPTANLDVAELVLPPNGVYAALATCKHQTWQAVLNIGHRPTVQSPLSRLHAEAHLLAFSGDLYGAEMEVMLVARLRDEKRFASLDSLRQQITRDVAEARHLF